MLQLSLLVIFHVEHIFICHQNHTMVSILCQILKQKHLMYILLVKFYLNYFLEFYHGEWKELKIQFNYITLSVLAKDLHGDHDNMELIHDILNWYHNVGLMIQGIVLQ